MHANLNTKCKNGSTNVDFIWLFYELPDDVFLCVFLFLRTLCHSIYTAHEYQPCNCVLLYRCDHSHYLG